MPPSPAVCDVDLVVCVVRVRSRHVPITVRGCQESVLRVVRYFTTPPSGSVTDARSPPEYPYVQTCPAGSVTLVIRPAPSEQT